jgi:hypothetical protein
VRVMGAGTKPDGGIWPRTNVGPETWQVCEIATSRPAASFVAAALIEWPEIVSHSKALPPVWNEEKDVDTPSVISSRPELATVHRTHAPNETEVELKPES